MIELKVEKYCENCPHFEADVDRIDICEPGEWVKHDTLVRCASREKCEEIHKAVMKDLCKTKNI